MRQQNLSLIQNQLGSGLWFFGAKIELFLFFLLGRYLSSSFNSPSFYFLHTYYLSLYTFKTNFVRYSTCSNTNGGLIVFIVLTVFYLLLAPVFLLSFRLLDLRDLWFEAWLRSETEYKRRG